MWDWGDLYVFKWGVHVETKCSQLGSTIISLVFLPGELVKFACRQLCLNLIGCHCFSRRVTLNWNRPSLASIVTIRAR